MSPAADRIYLDNAATSFPKPATVTEAMVRYSRDLGAAVGRSATRVGVEVQSLVDRCRANCAQLLGVSAPERVIFTFNGTDSLNLAIHGMLKPGDHVITTAIEHNSVLRPLTELQLREQIELSSVRPDACGVIRPDAIRSQLRPNTRLIVCQHASNVTGVIHPVNEIGQLAREHGIPFCVDAAQTAGVVPIAFDDQPIDLLACPGHKALMGPLGTGLLLMHPSLIEKLQPIRQGGTGSLSESLRQPMTVPDRFESGNHNAVGLVGLEAATTYLLSPEAQQRSADELKLTRSMVEQLHDCDKSRVHCHFLDATDRLGVFSVAFAGLEPQTACTLLDQEFCIETRAGLHCAPGAHEHVDSADFPAEGRGSVRFSLGHFNTQEHVDRAVEAINELSLGA